MGGKNGSWSGESQVLVRFLVRLKVEQFSFFYILFLYISLKEVTFIGIYIFNLTNMTKNL